MSLTDTQRDIAIKAAEGIQEGAWCIGAAFHLPGPDRRAYSTGDCLFQDHLTVDEALQSRRCAVGELALRTAQIGGLTDFQPVVEATASRVRALCPAVRHGLGEDADEAVTFHNDICMRTADPFTAGQEWARIFREVAES